MSELRKLIQRHLDRYGVKEAEFARRIGSTPQTLYTWKRREMRQLPDKRILEGIAEEAGFPYWRVLDAALVDSGYRSVYPDATEICQRLRGLSQQDCLLIAQVATELAAGDATAGQRTTGDLGPIVGVGQRGQTRSQTTDVGGEYQPSPWIEDLLDGGRQVIETTSEGERTQKG
ncbi:hypothetical protein [Nocardia altamirensis]|uniref:hypothetical protein n=1 Tax=Nocardia altamirensis TaxID=472158 RepID=UPI0008406FDE|nr:hypothetical protein [Nocardia altamirensis]